jgi:uncharacterized protein YndB with AHSA1/START domain
MPLVKIPGSIAWPERYHPDRTPVHVANEIVVAASPARVWAWLVRAALWPTWYPNARNVRLAPENQRTLELGTKFRWHTFGVGIRSTVLEFEPTARIAWNAFGLGVDAYHAWLIENVADGTRILTEETQYGWAARANTLVFPDRMHRFHQVWLEELGRRASGGLPPA